MQETEEIISKGLDILGKMLDTETEPAKVPEPATPNQPVETEAHEVESSEPWYHPHHLIHHAPTIIVAALGLVGMVVVAKINNRRKRRPT